MFVDGRMLICIFLLTTISNQALHDTNRYSREEKNVIGDFARAVPASTHPMDEDRFVARTSSQVKTALVTRREDLIEEQCI